MSCATPGTTTAHSTSTSGAPWGPRGASRPSGRWWAKPGRSGGRWVLNPDFRDLLSAFSGAEVRFLVVGAHAVSFHSVPRYTKDLDLWIEPTPENARRAWEALARFGAPLEGVAVDDLAAPGTVLQIGVEPNRIDVLTRVAGLDFRDAWDRRVGSTYGGVPVSFPSLEDLLASKRACGRPQDLLDAAWLEKAMRRA